MSNEIDIYGDLENYNDEQVLKEKSNEYQMLQEEYNNSLKIINDLQNEKKELQKKLKNIEKSFWSLLETAKIEVHRKDNQIDELRREIDNITFRRYNRGKQNKSENHVGFGKLETNNREKINLRDFKNNSKKEYNQKLKDSGERNCLSNNMQNEKPKNVIKNGQLSKETSSEEGKKKKNESHAKSKLEDVNQANRKSSNSENKCNIEVINKAETVTENFNDLLFDEMLNETNSLNIKSDDVNFYEDLKNNLNEDKFVQETQSNKTVTTTLKDEICNSENAIHIIDNLISSKNIVFEAPQNMTSCEKTETISNFTQEIYDVIKKIDNTNKFLEKNSNKFEGNLNLETSLTYDGKNNMQGQITFSVSETNATMYFKDDIQSDKIEKPDFNENEAINIVKYQIKNCNSHKKPKDNCNNENVNIFSDSTEKNLKKLESKLKCKNEKLLDHCIVRFEPNNNEKPIIGALELKKNLFEEIISENCVIKNIDNNDNLESGTINISNIPAVIKKNSQTIETINEIEEKKLNSLINKNNEINAYIENKTETMENNQKEISSGSSSIDPNKVDEKNIEETNDTVKEFKNESYAMFDTSLSSNIGLNNIDNKIINKINEHIQDIQKEISVTLDECFVNNKNEITETIPKSSQEINTPSNIYPISSDIMNVQKENIDQTEITSKDLKNKSDKMLNSCLILNDFDFTIIEENKKLEQPLHLNSGKIIKKITNKTEELLNNPVDKADASITLITKDNKSFLELETVKELKVEGKAETDKTVKYVEEINKSSSKNKSKQLHNIDKIESKQEIPKKNSKINILENIQIAPPKNSLINSQINDESKTFEDISDAKDVPLFSLRDIKPKILKPDVNKILPLLNNSLEINKAATDELVKILGIAPKINRTPKKYSFDIIKMSDAISPTLSNETIPKSALSKILIKSETENLDFSPNQSETLEATQFLTDNFLINNSEKSPLKGILKQLFGDTPKRSDDENEQNSLKYPTTPKTKINLDKLPKKSIKISNKIPIVKISKNLNCKLSKRNKKSVTCSKKELNYKNLKKKLENGKIQSEKQKSKNTESQSHLNQIPKSNEPFENDSKENSTHLINNQNIIDAYLTECNKCRELENEVSKKIFSHNTSPNVGKKTPLNELELISPVEKIDMDVNKENGKDYLQKQIDDIFGKSPLNLEYGQTSDCIFDETLNKSSELNNSSSSQKRLCTLDKIYEMSIDNDGTPIWNITKRRKRKRKISKSQNKCSFESVKKIKTDKYLINLPHEGYNNNDKLIFDEEKENSTNNSLLNSESYFSKACGKTEKITFEKNVAKDINLKQNEKQFICSYKIPKINRNINENVIETTCDRNKELGVISENITTNILSKEHCNLLRKESIYSLSNDFDLKFEQENLITYNENSFKKQLKSRKRIEQDINKSSDNEFKSSKRIEQDINKSSDNEFKSPKRIEQDINKSSDNDIEQEFLRIFGKSPNVSQTLEFSQIDDSFSIQNNQDNLTVESNTTNNKSSNNVKKNYNERHDETCSNTTITSLNSANNKKCFSTSTKTYKMICGENDGTGEIWIIKRKKKKKN